MSEDCVYVFFIKQKTAYEMRISDWSSDVCSSDLFISRRHSIIFNWIEQGWKKVLQMTLLEFNCRSSIKSLRVQKIVEDNITKALDTWVDFGISVMSR